MPKARLRAKRGRTFPTMPGSSLPCLTFSAVNTSMIYSSIPFACMTPYTLSLCEFQHAPVTRLRYETILQCYCFRGEQIRSFQGSKVVQNLCINL